MKKKEQTFTLIGIEVLLILFSCLMYITLHGVNGIFEMGIVNLFKDILGTVIYPMLFLGLGIINSILIDKGMSVAKVSQNFIEFIKNICKNSSLKFLAILIINLFCVLIIILTIEKFELIKIYILFGLLPIGVFLLRKLLKRVRNFFTTLILKP